MRRRRPARIRHVSNTKCICSHSGKVEVDSTVGPTLNFIPGRALRYAVSFDDETPQIITIVPANFKAQNGNRDWEDSVKYNGRDAISTHTIASPGYHTLKIWMVDPAVAVEKIVVDTGGVRELSRPAGKFSSRDRT